MLLARILDRLITQGRLTIVDATGRVHHFGSGGPLVRLRLADRQLEREVLYRPSLAVPEAYMDGRLVLEEGELVDFLGLMAVNVSSAGSRNLFRMATRVEEQLGALDERNPLRRARRNVAHHYDLSGELYEVFLDEERSYSCAYFRSEADDLETAQRAKERHIAAKLRLEPGLRVLDVGSGWGSLAFTLGRLTGWRIDVTGITLSQEQLAYANAKARRLGVADRVRFELMDYREMGGRFDRIVSVGMFEHVGRPHYADFFAALRRLLTPDGVALLHSIGRMAGPGRTAPFIRRYVFPGGYIPALSEVLPVIERTGFWVTDIEILRLHYAETLRRWRERFEHARARAKALYDERFCRMWEFYLAASEVFFRLEDGMNFQIQLAADRRAVPLTRDYMVDTERWLARSWAGARPDQQPAAE